MTLTLQTRNQVIASMGRFIALHQTEILIENQKDITAFASGDTALYERLKLDEKKIHAMIAALKQVEQMPDVLDVELYHYNHPNGLKITNQTSAFGTVLIIYESRPDVTVEAAVIAFKSGNKILLKGGKESLHTNLILVALWQKALLENNCSSQWVQYLNLDRTETQKFLKNPTQKVDLIIPRGGEGLINFVENNTKIPVLVSGRGNNFIYIEPSADFEQAIRIILNAKTQKTSACNALDKILVDCKIPHFSKKINHLVSELLQHKVTVFADTDIQLILNQKVQPFTADLWKEEFLSMKITINQVVGIEEAIEIINTHSGGHSASIITEDEALAEKFMQNVDCAAVYHNASTRFTDGGEFGLGAEMGISTTKLHHRGPLGVEHLVTNKWFIKGNGQVR